MRELSKSFSESVMNWTLCAALLLNIFFLLYINFAINPFAKNTMLSLEGVPQDVKVVSISHASHQEYVTFKLSGYEICYDDRDKNYFEVKAAICSGQPLKMAIYTRPVVFPFLEEAAKRPKETICTLQAGSREILTSKDTVQLEKDKKASIMLVGFISTLLLGVLFFLGRKRLLDNAKISPNT